MSRQFSEEEARQILALAAERDHVARTPAEERLTLEELEEAAKAGGIDPAHVRAAAADFLRPGRRSVHRTYLGVPVEISQTRVFPEAIGDPEWAFVVEACQQVFGRAGVVTEMGQTREWASGPDERDAPVRVVVEPTDAGTRVTAERKTWPRALGATVATTMTVAVGLVLFALWLGTGASGGLWLPAFVGVALSLAFGVGWFVKTRKDGRREAEAFDEVLGRVGHVIGASERAEPHQEGPGALPPGGVGGLPLLDLDALDGAEPSTVERERRLRT